MLGRDPSVARTDRSALAPVAVRDRIGRKQRRCHFGPLLTGLLKIGSTRRPSSGYQPRLGGPSDRRYQLNRLAGLACALTGSCDARIEAATSEPKQRDLASKAIRPQNSTRTKPGMSASPIVKNGPGSPCCHRLRRELNDASSHATLGGGSQRRCYFSLTCFGFGSDCGAIGLKTIEHLRAGGLIGRRRSNERYFRRLGDRGACRGDLGPSHCGYLGRL